MQPKSTKLHYPLFFSALFLLLLILEKCFTLSLHHPGEVIPSSIFILCFLFFITKIKLRITACIFFVYLAFIYFSQNLGLAIYGYWTPPYYIVLFFENMSEAIASTQNGIKPLLYAAGFSLVVLSVYFLAYRKSRSSRKHIVFDLIFILLITYKPISLLVTDTSSNHGELLSKRYTTIKAGHYATNYLFGKLIPHQFFPKTYYEEYTHSEYPVAPDHKVKNVILILGESLSATHVPALGYDKNTTPWLSQMAAHPRFLIKSTYAAGTFTNVALPMLLNMVPTPNADKHIMSHKTNLFSMAKMNGYHTYFHSAQAQDEMSLVAKLGLENIDRYTDATLLGYSRKHSALDHELVPLIGHIDFNQSNFLVLHQRGSHAPYTARVPQGYAPFGTKTYVQQYDNSIRYTDEFWQQVFDEINHRMPDDDWLLIYTSDHGQTVTENTISQGSLEKPGDYMVPTFIYSPSPQLQQFYEAALSHCQRLFHVQVATLLGHSLGYEIPIADCKFGVVTGGKIDGSHGFMEITATPDTTESDV